MKTWHIIAILGAIGAGCVAYLMLKKEPTPPPPPDNVVYPRVITTYLATSAIKGNVSWTIWQVENQSFYATATLYTGDITSPLFARLGTQADTDATYSLYGWINAWMR